MAESKWIFSLLLLYFFISPASLFAASEQAQKEEFNEELLLKPLPDRKVLAHFHFDSKANFSSYNGGYHLHLFPKLILTPISQSKKLRIPDNFARIYINELSTTSILKVPTGETQEVTLLKEDNQLWFHNGWQEFMEYYSISYAFFLLFNYDGNSNFSVLIFNPTACEISYQRNPSNNISKEQCEICPEEMNGDNEETSDTKEDTQFGRGYSMSRASKNYEELMKDVVAAGISRPKRPFFVTDIKSYALDTGLYLTRHN